MCAKYESAQLGRTGSAAARDLLGEGSEARSHRERARPIFYMGLIPPSCPPKPAGGLSCSPGACPAQPWAEPPAWAVGCSHPSPGTHAVQLALLPQVEGIRQLLEGVFQVHGDEGSQDRLRRREDRIGEGVDAQGGCATLRSRCFLQRPPSPVHLPQGSGKGRCSQRSHLDLGMIISTVLAPRGSVRTGPQTGTEPCRAVVCTRGFGGRLCLHLGVCVEDVTQRPRCLHRCLRYLWKRFEVDPQSQHGHHNHQGHKESCHLQKRKKLLQGLPKPPLDLSSPAASANGAIGHCSILWEQTIASEQ